VRLALHPAQRINQHFLKGHGTYVLERIDEYLLNI
jgi:hypothetical protein